MNDSQNRHELIAASLYRGEPAEPPRISFRVSWRDDIDASSPQLRAEISDLYSKMLDGNVSEVVPEGEQLPIFNDAEPFLLKIVMDSLVVVSRRLPGKLGRRLDEATFSERARDMMDYRLYDGLPATITQKLSNGETLAISRYVSYLRSSSSGRQLSGVDSNNLHRPLDGSVNAVEPPFVVGETYRLNKRGNKLGKVTLAMIIKPSGQGSQGTPIRSELASSSSFIPLVA